MGGASRMTPVEVQKEIIRLERVLKGNPQFPNIVKSKLQALRKKQDQLTYMQTHPIQYKIKQWLSDMFHELGIRLWDSKEEEG